MERITTKVLNEVLNEILYRVTGAVRKYQNTGRTSTSKDHFRAVEKRSVRQNFYAARFLQTQFARGFYPIYSGATTAQ